MSVLIITACLNFIKDISKLGHEQFICTKKEAWLLVQVFLFQEIHKNVGFMTIISQQQIQASEMKRSRGKKEKNS